MGLIITTSKNVKEDRLTLLNCCFWTYWFGHGVSTYEEVKRHPERYLKDADKCFARNAMQDLKCIYKHDKEAARVVINSATESSVRELINTLGDEGKKYLELLD